MYKDKTVTNYSGQIKFNNRKECYELKATEQQVLHQGYKLLLKIGFS